jgi:hypothetical protein
MPGLIEKDAGKEKFIEYCNSAKEERFDSIAGLVIVVLDYSNEKFLSLRNR